VTGRRVVIQNEMGAFERDLSESNAADAAHWIGHLVEFNEQGALHVLTPNRTPDRLTSFADHVLHPRRLRGIEVREKTETAIRDFFRARGFRETRTPLLVPSPGMEPHIRPFAATRPAANPDAPLPRLQQAYLPTSPEFAMKRLLAGGLERIFQICPAFRDEPEASTHRPEFTMLEWYRAYAGYEDLMKDAEELVENLALRLHGQPWIDFAGRRISVKTPWPRLRVRDLFMEYAGVDLVACAGKEALARECGRLGLSPSSSDTWDDLYFRIWLNLIEPRLPVERAAFVTRYPESQAALAVVDADEDGSRWARRFEAYAGGLELGNAFEELTDPVEQRLRFEKDMRLRSEIYGPAFPPSPMDEGFLGALTEGMPPAGGIAMGVDRLVMLLADENEIGFTFWL
jgi:lysyl-tRNA synthetase class 2